MGPKGDGQIYLLEWHGLLSRHNAMKGRYGWLDARSVNAHSVERLGVHDVKAAASIHQYLGESLHADDRVYHEQISPRLWDALQVVGLIKGYARLRPSEESRHGRLGHIDLTARKLLVALGVIGRRPSEDHEAAIRHRKVTVFPLGIIHGQVRVLPVLPFVRASRQEPLHEAVVLV